MADAPQKVNTPDGREWLVSIEGRKRSMKETRQQPLFWAHVVVTAIIAGVMIWIFRNNSGILWILVVATVVIWAVGFLGFWLARRLRVRRLRHDRFRSHHRNDRRTRNGCPQPHHCPPPGLI